jgi:hypothetical protein
MFSGVVSIAAIPSSSLLQLHEQSRVPSLGQGSVVPCPQTILWTPPTPDTARHDFVSLYAPVDVLLHRRIGSPALDWISSAACRPCYPGRVHRPLPFSSAGARRPSPSDQRVGFSTFINEATYRFACATACSFAVGNLRPLIAQTPPPRAIEAHGQLLGRDLNPQDTQLLPHTVRY